MQPGTILIVDDNLQVLGIIAELLAPLGRPIRQASSGREALATARAEPPDLVLLDVMMPEMDGFSVCRQLRSDPTLAQVPVIMITALDDRESRVRGFEAGADEFISKPFDTVELRARVNTILRLNRYRQLLAEQARASRERERFAWAVERSDDGYLLLGPDDAPRYLNPCARHLLGLGPHGLPDQPFPRLAARHFDLVPPESWADWPRPHDDETPYYMVRPESRSAGETWLRVDVLPQPDEEPDDDSLVVRLRDVTGQILSQREMWTFHAMLSHKLRTPLVGILGGLNILSGSAGTMDRDGIARISDVALASARRLQSEIEDVLRYLRSPGDVYGIESPQAAELPELAGQVAAELGVAPPLVAVAPELIAGHVQIAMARQSLEVLIHELLDNSRKFHPGHAPTVEISAAPSELGVVIRISDDGGHLSPEQLDLAWRPYYQGERSFTGQVEGMGLGLALVARIVFAVGGRYRLTNRSDRLGVTAELDLPVRAG